MHASYWNNCWTEPVPGNSAGALFGMVKWLLNLQRLSDLQIEDKFESPGIEVYTFYGWCLGKWPQFLQPNSEDLGDTSLTFHNHLQKTARSWLLPKMMWAKSPSHFKDKFQAKFPHPLKRFLFLPLHTWWRASLGGPNLDHVTRPGQIHTNSGDFLDIYSQMMMSDWGGVLHHRNETQVQWFFNGSMSHTISQFRWLPGSLGNPLIRRSKFAELPGSKKRIHGRFLFVCFVHPKNHGLKRGVWMSIARVWDLQQQVLRSHDS